MSELKGTPLKEWIETPTSPDQITTARVFLIVGGVLGTLFGIGLMSFIILLAQVV